MQINGDRPVLKKEQESWSAWGSPYAGSSGYHVDQSCRIRAVFVLEQRPENRAERLGPSEAFAELYRETIVNSWDAAYVSDLSALIGGFVKEVPVYRLWCTAEVSAVDYVREMLEEGETDAGF